MKLLKKPLKSGIKPKEAKEEKSMNEKYPDTYKDEIEPVDFPIDETRKFVLSVKRDGDYGLPHVDIRQYNTTDSYTGFTKKGINFPIEYLVDLIDSLQEVLEECEQKNLIE